MSSHFEDILQFALNMPPLLDCLGDLDPQCTTSFFPDSDFVRQAMSRAIRSPHQWLQVFNQPEHKPLGRLFERMVHASLLAGFPDRQITANVQLRSKIQPGELDFVIADLSRTIHLEVAIKFYLFVPAPMSCASTANFHGPQLRDRLDLKLEKLILKQLRHKIPEDVRSPNPNAAIHRALWLTGMLFYPARHFIQQDFPNFTHLGINPRHLKGWWCDESELSQVFTNQDHHFLILSKRQWVDPMKDSVLIKDADAKSLLGIDQCLALSEPQLVLRIDEDGRALDRGFIVPYGWGPHSSNSR